MIVSLVHGGQAVLLWSMARPGVLCHCQRAPHAGRYMTGLTVSSGSVARRVNKRLARLVGERRGAGVAKRIGLFGRGREATVEYSCWLFPFAFGKLRR